MVAHGRQPPRHVGDGRDRALEDGQEGAEGEILRYVFWHSIALAALVGVLVFLQA